MEFPHTKRYVVVFQRPTRNPQTHFIEHLPGWEDITEFDTLKEAKCQISFYKEYYDDTDDTWGMVLLDYLTCKVIEWHGNCKVETPDNQTASKPTERYNTYWKLSTIDRLFRREGEVPEGYKWDDGEYEGWLQYRWGDGKNAVDYNKKNKITGTLSKDIDYNDTNLHKSKFRKLKGVINR